MMKLLFVVEDHGVTAEQTLYHTIQYQMFDGAFTRGVFVTKS